MSAIIPQFNDGTNPKATDLQRLFDYTKLVERSLVSAYNTGILWGLSLSVTTNATGQYCLAVSKGSAILNDPVADPSSVSGVIVEIAIDEVLTPLSNLSSGTLYLIATTTAPNTIELRNNIANQSVVSAASYTYTLSSTPSATTYSAAIATIVITGNALTSVTYQYALGSLTFSGTNSATFGGWGGSQLVGFNSIVPTTITTPLIAQHNITHDLLNSIASPGTGYCVNTDNIFPQAITADKIANNTITINQLDPGLDFIPVGCIMLWPGPVNKIPDNWLVCDGSGLLIADFPELYAAIGSYWGVFNSTGLFFSIPDLRNQFIRSTPATNDITTLSSLGAQANPASPYGSDPDAATRAKLGTGGYSDPGSYQADQFQNHVHHGPKNSVDYATTEYRSGAPGSGGGYTGTYGYTGDAHEGRFGSETRPMNVYMSYIIKVQ